MVEFDQRKRQETRCDEETCTERGREYEVSEKKEKGGKVVAEYWDREGKGRGSKSGGERERKEIGREKMKAVERDRNLR